MRSSLISLTAFLVFSFSCSRPAANRSDTRVDGPGSNGTPTAETMSEHYSVVFTIPTGEGGINYANVDEKESEPWGPGGFTIQDDGTFLIVDTAADRILKYGSDGSRLSTITLKDVVGITDVTADDANVYVLDQAAPVPQVIRLSPQGGVVKRK